MLPAPRRTTGCCSASGSPVRRNTTWYRPRTMPPRFSFFEATGTRAL
jgi:hypothetical protein